MTSTVSIRNATIGDVPQIHSFIRDLAIFEKLEQEHVGTEADLEETLFGASAPYAHVVFAVIDGVDVGFALYYYTYSTFLSRPGIHLEDLFVSDSVRGKGVGTALLKHLAKIAKESNFKRVEWAALDWNTPAINFYTGNIVRARELKEWKMFRLTGDELDAFAKA
ncbi:hypothetical protein HK100_006208 [Physocladia obscura]|uniref:N-acetyltransferase domain-containing protein n=1 Tax=Physocladia obscura TaxID=109957 RepID=A0AAD5SWC5_9FUNG|nr:hypothetical protein HK100_006208 [Physocladia obscura]